MCLGCRCRRKPNWVHALTARDSQTPLAATCACRTVRIVYSIVRRLASFRKARSYANPHLHNAIKRHCADDDVADRAPAIERRAGVYGMDGRRLRATVTMSLVVCLCDGGVCVLTVSCAELRPAAMRSDDHEQSDEDVDDNYHHHHYNHPYCHHRHFQRLHKW